MSIERLAVVMTSAIDVTPTDAVIYVSSFEKAWEYGGFPKVVPALDGRLLDSTYRSISADASMEEQQDLQKIFPTALRSRDGKKLWFSRLSADDPGITTDYEMAYAKWIPRDPFAALKAVLIFFRDQDDEQVKTALADIV